MPTLLGVLLIVVSLCLSDGGAGQEAVSPGKSLVWGPGLHAQFVVPVRYFFVQLKDAGGNNISTSVGEEPFHVLFSQKGSDGNGRIRIHLQQLDRHDGSYIMRYRMYSSSRDLMMAITYQGVHVGNSPFTLEGVIYHDGCSCAVPNTDVWLESMHCPSSYPQIERDLATFPNIVFSKVVPEVWERFNHSGSRSLCRYVIKDNKLYRSTMGKHVGFKMFSDAILLSIMRKVKLPDLEFYVNLGDWPLELRTARQNPLPILSWCGSEDSMDIVMPTYDVTESTLETMGRVTLDLMSVQASTPVPWTERKEMVFWRGRDSRRERLDLVKTSIRNPKLIDAKLTNMFFFKHDKDEVGEIVKHSSFFSFFDYKYQINVDGTVAAYRFPYLLAGGSLVFKQESKYYEHFYNDLRPYVHYVPLKADLSDLKEKVKWAKDNDEKARQISLNARQYVVDNLLAKDIFCYHVLLFKKYAARLKEVPKVQKDMDRVEQPEDRYNSPCECHHDDVQMTKNEL